MADSNVLALDIGERRIGVAIAHLEARIPRPLATIDRQTEPDIFKTLTDLAQEHNAETIVVGLPRGMDGQETAQTTSVREFASQLKESFSGTLALQDEAGTSLVAEEELQAKGGAYEKGDIDKLAATYILQDWLAGATVEPL